jgi:prepilin-type N-terminal cleavage/methylation domain-containing protein
VFRFLSARKPVLGKDGRRLGCKRAFTLLEMLVSMVVLALLVVTMTTLVDGAARLWRHSEGRTDACREARAALIVMARDLRNAVAGTNASLIRFNLQSGAASTNHGSNIFFLASLPSSAQDANSKSDVCEVGYFLALDRTPASTNQTLNLYRYFRDSNQTFSNLAAGTSFANIAAGEAGEELLARNVVGMTIKPVSAASGDWTDFAPSSNAPLPAMIEITLTAIGQETAKKLENAANWTDTNSPLIKGAMQTLTTRISVGQNQ